MQFGVDLSHHKPGFDFARAAAEGVTFVILKATEGDRFTDSLFAGYLRAARAAGLLVAAYHYQLATVSAARQVEHVLQTVPADVPLAVDVEARSGGVALTREIVLRLRQADRRVVLTYLPRWYWTQLGSPDLSGLPPLWNSRYPDMIVGTLAQEWADVPDTYWAGYGGLPVAVLQFTSSAAVANYPAGSIDANAYPGTRTQLAALLGGAPEDDMTAAEIWAHPLPDPYPGAAPKPAGVLLGWAATHGAYAREEAGKATAAGLAARSAVAELARQLGNADLVAVVEAAFDARLDEAETQIAARMAQDLAAAETRIAEQVSKALADAVIDVDVTVHGATP